MFTLQASLLNLVFFAQILLIHIHNYKSPVFNRDLNVFFRFGKSKKQQKKRYSVMEALEVLAKFMIHLKALVMNLSPRTRNILGELRSTLWVSYCACFAFWTTLQCMFFSFMDNIKPQQWCQISNNNHVSWCKGTSLLLWIGQIF